LAKDDIIIKTIELYNERTKYCNQQLHRTTFYLLTLSIVFLIYAQFGLKEISLLGTKIEVPKPYVLFVAPLILVFLYHQLVAYTKLEGLYHRRIKHYYRSLCKENECPTEKWEEYLLETPSYYTWSEIRDAVEAPKFFKFGQVIMYKVIFTFYVGLFPIIIGYFLWNGKELFDYKYTIPIYLFALLMTAYSMFQYFEDLQYKGKKI